MRVRRSTIVTVILGLGAASVLALVVGATWSDLLVWYKLSPQFTLRRWTNERGYREYRHEGTGIIMVLLPPGTFTMGSPETEEGGQADERPCRRVEVERFLIAKREVTQEEWTRAMGSNPSHHQGEHLPVEMVSWTDCKAFCEKTGLRFPTEAEWEYACRGGMEAPFSMGSMISSDLANFDARRASSLSSAGTFRGCTTPAGSFPPNGFGLQDVHGNVWEWCEDVYEQNFPGAPSRPRHPRDERRIIRGGSWFDSAPVCRSAYRGSLEPEEKNHLTGFRPAFTVP